MKRKIKIIADDKIPFLKGVLEPFASVGYVPGNSFSNEIVSDADALIIRTRTICNESLLKNSSVKLITTATIGFDHIDREYCDQNNIKWISSPGCNSTSVMQYITTVLLKIAQKDDFLLKTKTIGIVGVGNVGSKVQKIAEILGMKVLLNDPPRALKEGENGFVTLTEIMEESDIITFHVPLTREGKHKTYHMGDELFFSNLSKTPMIINSSRGEVIKTSALKSAVKAKKVGKIFLDVWENEPNIDLELMNYAEISTPHIAGYSADGKANGTATCVNEVNDCFNLGIESNWYPPDIPIAKKGNLIFIDCDNKTEQQIIEEVVSKTYDISYDDKKLKSNPDEFELHRGNYHVRREFSNYIVELNGCTPEVEKKIKHIGFNLKPIKIEL